MDPMIIGTTVPFVDGAAVALLSPWMPRQGNTVRFTVELIDAVEIKLIIQTKNVEDIDSAATDVANSQSDTNPVTVRGTGLKELVRYKVVTNPSPETFGFDTGVLRCLDPQWEYNQ